MKSKAVYMALGAVLGIGGMVIGMTLSPVTAQNDSFGEITCTGLKVVNADGHEQLWLTVDENGGMVRILAKNGMPVALINTVGTGGRVTLTSKFLHFEGEELIGGRQIVSMGIDENGGHVSVSGKDGKSAAGMHIDQYGGQITVRDKLGKGRRL